jgi:cation:H+ antiporter
MLPLAYNLSGGHWNPMPLDARQSEEIFLTCAQSLFGLVVLMNFSFSLGEALWLFALFATQIFFTHPAFRYGYAVLYLVLALAAAARSAGRRRELRYLFLESWRGKPS